MDRYAFLVNTLLDGFELIRLGNLKMFAEAKTQRVAEEWADELINECDWTIEADYARMIRAFKQIRREREELGAFCVFYQYLQANPRNHVALPVKKEPPLSVEEQAKIQANLAKIKQMIKELNPR